MHRPRIIASQFFESLGLLPSSKVSHDHPWWVCFLSPLSTSNLMHDTSIRLTLRQWREAAGKHCSVFSGYKCRLHWMTSCRRDGADWGGLIFVKRSGGWCFAGNWKGVMKAPDMSCCQALCCHVHIGSGDWELRDNRMTVFGEVFEWKVFWYAPVSACIDVISCRGFESWPDSYLHVWLKQTAGSDVRRDTWTKTLSILYYLYRTNSCSSYYPERKGYTRRVCLRDLFLRF